MVGLASFGIRFTFLVIAFGAVSTMLRAFAPVLPQALLQAIATIFSSLQSFSFIVPLETLGQVLATATVFWSAMLLWSIIEWVLNVTKG